jgi:glycerate kinase
LLWVLASGGFRDSDSGMRALIAVDKFKGSIPALAVAEAIAAGLRRGGVDWEVDLCPIADGGEGTTEAVVGALAGDWVEVAVVDALGRPVRARYGLVTGRNALREAVMEMSAASGLALVLDEPLNPLVASTFGTGMMMRDAAGRGVERVRIGIGGSATNDGGMGMARALGYRFLNAAGEPVEALPERFEEVARILHPEGGLPLPAVEVACDVDNPLLGARGATRVYGRQKGVTREQEAFFEGRLERLAEMVRRDLGVDPRDVAGAGAAGGLGFGLMAFCGARLVEGFHLVAEVVGLRERMERAEIVITGEGRLDAQTLCGKGPVGVARMARKLGKRVIGIGGGVESGVGLEAEFDLLAATKPEGMPLAEAMARGAGLIEETVVRLADVLREW